MNLTKNVERQRRIGILREWFRALPDGELVLWIRIESETGLKMDMAGRALVRCALAAERREKVTVPGDGFHLSSPTNAMAIMQKRFGDMRSSVRRADRTRTRLTERHYAAMDASVQRSFTALAGFFGQVSAIAAHADKHIIGRLQRRAERAARELAEKEATSSKTPK